MNGKIVKDDWLSIVKELNRDEIEEFLFSQTFCSHCEADLTSRVQSIANLKSAKRLSMSSHEPAHSDDFSEGRSASLNEGIQESSSKSVISNKSLMNNSGGWKNYSDKFSPVSVDSKYSTSSSRSVSGRSLDEEMVEDEVLSEEQKEKLGFANVGRKTNFVHYEKVNGKNVNVVQGLELHTRVFSADEQKKIVESVYEFQRLGQKGRLRERTYTEPNKWMRGKGRITIQFGCCYNYAVDKNGNPPGIIRDEEVDPLPPIFIQMIKRMVRWHVLPPTCIPNSCIVNIYEEGDCIPPHIDHHDFVRPFCTISFLTQCNILFGSNLKIIGPGEFSGPVSIPLPVGSVLVLKGNGADVAKHSVPAVPAKRISITFRKMDESKIPYGYSPNPELQGLRPLPITPPKSPSQQKHIETKVTSPTTPTGAASNSSSPSLFPADDFPALGATNASDRRRGYKKA
ncbi:RNA demethylase ALKBH9B-like [Rutidosis leptorrhynchoides]|uniref:RNA demethylase ALKBH9B-like n=1 Tax=Rutidosis leptorrhynchoides TaxID=125765 RepID=UPI003A99EE50